MQTKVIAYGVARDILVNSEIWLAEVKTVGDVRQRLMSQYAEFGKLASLRFAVNERYQSDDYVLKDGDEVIIIPPVSGG